MPSEHSTDNRGNKLILSIKTKALAAITLLSVLSQPAFADEKLAGAKNCLGCHAVGTQVLGPSFKEVAKKYTGNKVELKKLTGKMRFLCTFLIREVNAVIGK